MRGVLLRFSHGATRLFRNNTGTGWVGNVTRLADGSLLIKNPRPLHAGLCKGSSDLIGWTAVTVTPDMVGKRVAVFTAIECKAKKGKATSDQQNFVDVINQFGGLAAVVSSDDQVAALLNTQKANESLHNKSQ